MGNLQQQRRNFLRRSAAAAGLALLGSNSFSQHYLPGPPPPPPANPRIRFSVININHNHIYGMVDAVTRGGGLLVAFYAKEPALVAEFSARYPNAKLARSKEEILEDNSLQVILSSGIPVERAPLGIEVMRHGKDFLVDKPGITEHDQLAAVRKVQKETGRIYSILFSERHENKATVRAGELIRQGAIGRVLQTVGLGPHRINIPTRPDWFFHRKNFGGILTDIGSHQFDQFLHFTGSTEATIVAAQTGNLHHPQYPNMQDFGDVMIRGNKGTGYIRVDWFTPDALGSWGDGRLTILGTDGYIEVRKNIDIAGPAGGNHLYLVNHKETRFIDCNNDTLPFGNLFVDDVLNRTETAMSQQHCFLATELALLAQQQAVSITDKIAK
ncbi:MAG: Gfo/Idh/MocA family oxidoreductase [Chitinophagaceae bacterium]|nr:Gfo/Idh/MocA family oxidoreductase [Chitinophagaceae bacterium]MCA6512811.1 Gfo/Idh/MocA family oxidoreductase [Chitinophagaceae bacterium]